MIGLLRDMFLTPEAQRDAYGWAAVLLAHTALGALLTAVLGLARIGMIQAAALAVAAYGLLWEGGQILLAGAAARDSLVDAAAFTFGAALLAAAWARAGGPLAAAIAGLLGALAAGVKPRK